MIRPLHQLGEIISKALSSQKKLHRPFVKFFTDVMILYLTIADRINFSQMARYGKFSDSTYRQNFARQNVDWLTVNKSFLPKDYVNRRRAIAIDPSYIPKSGTKTPGLAYFWSGCASAVKKGLEILGIACVFADGLTEGYFLKAEQTFKDKKFKGRIPEYLQGMDNCDSLIAWYLRMLFMNREQLQEISNIIVADAYFSKETFATGLSKIGFELISRFRDDVRLCYLYTGPQSKGKGRPKKYDGPVDLKNLRDDVFVTETVEDRGESILVHSAIVYAVSLKRIVKVVIADYVTSNKKTQTRKVYFSTDLSLSAGDILRLYRARFKIEFIFRDAKEFTGLTHCQSRKKESLSFAFNMSGTAVNIAKQWASEMGLDISVGSVKCILKNAAMIERIISMFGKSPNMKINSTDFKELLFLGVRSTLKGQYIEDLGKGVS